MTPLPLPDQRERARQGPPGARGRLTARPVVDTARADVRRRPTARTRWLPWARPLAWPVAISALALVTTMPYLGRRSLWYDETFSFTATLGGLRGILRVISTGEANMGPYYALLRAWRTLGESEFALRSLSVVLAVAAIPVMYALAKELFGGRVAKVSCVLMAVNTFYVSYAQEARAYSLILLATLAASYCFLRMLDDSRWWWCAGYVAAAAVATYCHFFGGLIPLAHASSLVFLPRRSIPWRRLLVTAVAYAGVVVPMGMFVLYAARHLQFFNWIPQPTAGTLRRLFLTMAGDSRPLHRAYQVALLVGVGAGVVTLRSSGRSRAAWRYGFLLTWLVVPVTTSFVYSVWIKPLFLDRYFLMCLPPFLVLASVGICQLRWRLLVTAAVVVMCVWAGQSLRGWYHSPAKQEWRGAADYLASRASSDSRLVLSTPYDMRLTFDYYARHGARAEHLRHLPVAYVRQDRRQAKALNRYEGRGDQLWLMALVNPQNRAHVEHGLERDLGPGYRLASSRSFYGLYGQLAVLHFEPRVPA